MNAAKALIYHRILFVYLALATLLLAPFISSLPNYLAIGVALILFFCVGIPHGALDVAIGKVLFQVKLGRWWPFFFFGSYLALSFAVVALWIVFPLASFLFFLAISAFHFGGSDTEEDDRITGVLETITRGLLPITVPCYYNKVAFQQIIQFSLSPYQADFVIGILSWLFIPTVTLLVACVAYKIFKKEIFKALELALVFILFMFLKPFVAFLVYFCFLHSMRHILNVLIERKQNLNVKSIKWMVLEAFPATLCTLITLCIFYLKLREGILDLALIVNIFFISIAALTFPHMILVELAKRKK